MSIRHYNVFISPNLKGRIEENLPPELKGVFDRKVKYFSNNPFHPSLNTKKYNVSEKALKTIGIDEIWEFYINRYEYRCIFYVIHNEQKIIIVDVGNHRQIEKKYSW